MTEWTWTEADDEAVKTAKLLAADAVERVGNGHPGTAISLAAAAYVLYQKVMRKDPTDPSWPGADRFILSAGHASVLQYVQLYLGGFGLELDDLKALRTWNSLTPGHPEYGHTPGVEMTTGPLGQGLASAVGFAYAQRFERELFDADAAPGTSPFDHSIYVIAGDGDLQEGVTSEAASLAGHQELGNLVVIYDANQISIEDDTDIAFTEDVAQRYASYGWHVHTVTWRDSRGYGEDVEALYAAIAQARDTTNKPSLIILKTVIGWPSPTKQNSGKIHGSALGAEELRGLKQALGADPDKHFDVSERVISHTRALADRSRPAREQWNTALARWSQAHPEKAALRERLYAGELPADLERALPQFADIDALSTRAASGATLNALAPLLPELWGGSADLAESNNTTINGAGSFVPSRRSTRAWTGAANGRVLHFGVREHAMGAILNGITLHGPTRPFGGTFLVFSDYMRPAVRLAALMSLPSLFIWTHDSVALGEDGPTHQPIEHLATLRAIPGFEVVRPADATETAAAWLEILRRRRPTGFVLSRQNLPVLHRTEPDSAPARAVARGAYVLAESPKEHVDVILIATGSEVHVALAARENLAAEGIGARVVSAPSLEWFAEQDAEYRESVLPSEVRARVSVEAGSTLGWREVVGATGRVIGIDHFGASADGALLLQKFGITAEAVVRAARASLLDSED